VSRVLYLRSISNFRHPYYLRPWNEVANFMQMASYKGTTKSVFTCYCFIHSLNVIIRRGPHVKNINSLSGFCLVSFCCNTCSHFTSTKRPQLKSSVSAAVKTLFKRDCELKVLIGRYLLISTIFPVYFLYIRYLPD